MSGLTGIAVPDSSHIAEFHEIVKLNLTFSENLAGFSSDSESVSLSIKKSFSSMHRMEKSNHGFSCAYHACPQRVRLSVASVVPK